MHPSGDGYEWFFDCRVIKGSVFDKAVRQIQEKGLMKLRLEEQPAQIETYASRRTYNLGTWVNVYFYAEGDVDQGERFKEFLLDELEQINVVAAS